LPARNVLPVILVPQPGDRLVPPQVRAVEELLIRRAPGFRGGEHQLALCQMSNVFLNRRQLGHSGLLQDFVTLAGEFGQQTRQFVGDGLHGGVVSGRLGIGKSVV